MSYEYEEEADNQEFVEESYEDLSPEEQVYQALSAEEKQLYAQIQEKLRMTDPVIQALAEMKNAPTPEMIDSFKSSTGDEVYFISMSDKENFLFRPIRRQEWRALMGNIAKLDEYKKSEAIVMKGVLYPQLSQVNVGALAAGSIETLKEVILRASNFMPPDMAVSLVRKL
jgi:hypothetical protein